MSSLYQVFTKSPRLRTLKPSTAQGCARLLGRSGSRSSGDPRRCNTHKSGMDPRLWAAVGGNGGHDDTVGMHEISLGQPSGVFLATGFALLLRAKPAKKTYPCPWVHGGRPCIHRHACMGAVPMSHARAVDHRPIWSSPEFKKIGPKVTNQSNRQQTCSM